MSSIPEPPDTRGASLVMAAVIYWTVVVGLVLMVACTYAYVTHDAPPVAKPCIVAPGHSCIVRTSTGDVTAYMGYGGWVGVATPTPTPARGGK